MLLRDYNPALKYGAKILGSEVLSGIDMFAGNKESVFFVDADNGSDNNDGKTPDTAKATIQSAVNAAAAANKIYKCGSTVYIKPKKIAAGATDPNSYAETIIIPADGGDNMKLIGVSSNRTQGGLPQIKIGSGSTAMITIRAMGCTIANLGINGAGSTGGGILLDDDGSTKSAFGTTIVGCHFKNCKCTATDSRTGGAIMWSANGGAWQTSIIGNQFYKNVGGITLIGTSVSLPQDVLIANNDFLGTAATVDSYMYLVGGGSGMANVMVRDNYFASVLPALGSGSVVRYVDLTGCTGIFANNYFASTDTTTGFGAAKASAKIPATVGIAHNYSDGGLIVREA